MEQHAGGQTLARPERINHTYAQKAVDLTNLRIAKWELLLNRDKLCRQTRHHEMLVDSYDRGKTHKSNSDIFRGSLTRYKHAIVVMRRSFVS